MWREHSMPHNIFFRALRRALDGLVRDVLGGAHNVSALRAFESIGHRGALP
jgi:hypothetical protein